MQREISQNNNKQNLRIDKVITLFQYLIPQHLLSVTMHKLTQSEIKWLKNALISFVTWKYRVNLSEAETAEKSSFNSFNAFFTRALKSGVRTIEGGESTLVSPVDGAISQLGKIQFGTLIQAKNHDYFVTHLLGGEESQSLRYQRGQFVTIYLSPKDYHRIHMPISGKLVKMTYVPGDLFSVSPRTARAVPNLFARNERLVIEFESALGRFVLVMVGAIFVGSMETVWQGQITPPYGKRIMTWDYDDEAIYFNKGEEIGRFNMGSTVIMLLPDAMPEFQDKWGENAVIKLGQAMN